jgi:formate hydrogenlyase subunit 3/multisubunit Na+/H+ antiporter MnhD subunit
MAIDLRSFWILLDLCLFVVFCVTLYKQKGRFQKFLYETRGKEQVNILVRNWLMPAGIAFVLWGGLWLGFHNTTVYKNIQTVLYPQPQVMSENATPLQDYINERDGLR